MTILAALAGLYDRMEEAGEAPPPGYSSQKIGAEVVLDTAGKVLDIRRQGNADGNKWRPKILSVPKAVKRTSGIESNTLWDKTSYTLGVTALKDDKGKPLVDADRYPIPRQEKTNGERA